MRAQKQGKQKPWTTEQLEEGLRHFFNEHGHYPTATEVDGYPYLPSARTIERSHGGIIALRKKLGLGAVSEHDLRFGPHSSQRARLINSRAHNIEKEVYTYLVERFGKAFVHREYFFTDDHRTRADFFVYDNKKGFCVDVFYPNSKRNLSGCLNIKLNKYDPEQMQFLDYPVIFLQMNNNLTQEEIDKLVKNKKRALGKNQYLMTWDTFKAFCDSRGAFKDIQQP